MFNIGAYDRKRTGKNFKKFHGGGDFFLGGHNMYIPLLKIHMRKNIKKSIKRAGEEIQT